MNWSEIAAIVAAILAVASLLWHIITFLRHKLPALAMKIRVFVEVRESSGNSQDKRSVMIKCDVGNRGENTLYIKEAKLLVDEGWHDNHTNEVKFPSIWQWRKHCPDCELSRWFQTEHGNAYPEYIDPGEIDGRYTSCADMFYFVKAIEYVLPGESFTDTKVLYLDKDCFYRLTFIVIPYPIRFLWFFKRKVDCLCVTTQIPPGIYTELGS